MKDTLKTHHKEITIVTSVETGEVLDISKKDIKVLTDTDDFCLTYVGLWNVLLDNPLSKSDIELFSFLVQNYSDGTPFTITDYIKQQISIKSGKVPSSYNNSTRSLLKSELIYKVGKKDYKINPKYAFQGSSKNRHQAVIEMLSLKPL
jgi:hypothetical protein